MTRYKIGQYFNLDGITNSIYYIFRPRLLKPDLIFKRFDRIDLEKIPSNIKYIVLDKDNTLTLPHAREYADTAITNKVEEFKNKFGSDNIAIISNSAGSSDDIEYNELKLIETNLNLKVIKHKFKKPNVYTEIKQHFSKNDQITIVDTEICIIGDRLLVDIIMGKEFNFYTVLVGSIMSSKDNFIVRQIRLFEKILIKI